MNYTNETKQRVNRQNNQTKKKKKARTDNQISELANRPTTGQRAKEAVNQRVNQKIKSSNKLTKPTNECTILTKQPVN
jgi:hypothetical protein